jgi:hypothetical protein
MGGSWSLVGLGKKYESQSEKQTKSKITGVWFNCFPSKQEAMSPIPSTIKKNKKKKKEKNK